MPVVAFPLRRAGLAVQGLWFGVKAPASTVGFPTCLALVRAHPDALEF